MAGLGGFLGYALGGINWDATFIGIITIRTIIQNIQTISKKFRSQKISKDFDYNVIKIMSKLPLLVEKIDYQD